MKKHSIRTAILIPSLTVLIFGIAVMIFIIGILSSKTANDLTDQLIEARVNESANSFQALCQEIYGSIATASTIISNYIDPAFVADVADPRTEVIDILGKTIDTNYHIISIWTCWEPNAFDGKDSAYVNADYHDNTGRFIPVVYRDGASYAIDALVGYESSSDGEFYTVPKSTGRPHLTDPYIYNLGGKDTLLCTISIPILNNGQVVGVVGADLDLNEFVTSMNSTKLLDDGYLITISSGGLLATHPDQNLILTPYANTWMKGYGPQVENIVKNGGSFHVSAYSDIIQTDVKFLGSGVKIGETDNYWLVCGIIPSKTVNASSNAIVWMIIIIGFALVVCIALTLFIIVRRYLRRLPLLTETAEALAVGNIDFVNLKTDTDNTKNEITLLTRAFVKMTEGIRQQARILDQISQGDYSVEIDVRSEHDVMNQAINILLESTNDTLNQINHSTVQVFESSQQMANASQSLAQGSTEQAAAVDQLSSSISAIAAKTKENAEMALRTADLANTIKTSAEKGSHQMDQMMEAVHEINQASQSINKVIKVIDDIAFQTNILALNAAVEAARAGQHGKGFAVVAEEVRSLAAKSAEAAKDTSGLIVNSIEKAELGARIADETAASLVEIVSGINESSRLVNDIAKSSEEQSEGISQINKGIELVAQGVQQVSATAEESAAASEEMNGQSDNLTQLVAQFKLKDEGKTNWALSAGSRTEAPQLASAKTADKDSSFGKY